jgi:hypothetical protein
MISASLRTAVRSNGFVTRIDRIDRRCLSATRSILQDAKTPSEKITVVPFMLDPTTAQQKMKENALLSTVSPRVARQSVEVEFCAQSLRFTDHDPQCNLRICFALVWRVCHTISARVRSRRKQSETRADESCMSVWNHKLNNTSNLHALVRCRSTGRSGGSHAWRISRSPDRPSLRA